MVTGTLQKRLTKEEAQDQGLVPAHHGWDEDLQRALPIGELVRADMIRRPLDLGSSLEAIEKNREILKGFIAKQMAESDYKADKYPAPGQMHDFYKLPNYDKKVLTKQGSEKLAQLFRLRRATTQSVDRQCTKEFTMAVVRVELVDQYGQPAGSGEAACTTAETGFARSTKKYNGDFRAALNDVVSRAGKRAFVQAVVYATATDEIFDASGDVEKAAEAQGVTEETTEAAEGARLPKGCGSLSGKLLSECPSDKLSELAKWLRSKGKATYDAVADAIAQELDLRRDQPSGEEFPG